MNVRNKNPIDGTDSYACSAKCPCAEYTNCGRCFNNIIDDRGFVLMLTPKCGTQSIVNSYINGAQIGLIQWRSKSYVAQLDYLKIGFVRNPFDRLVSCWQWWCVENYHRTFPIYGIDKNCTFSDFVNTIVSVPHNDADKHWRSQSHDMLSEDGLIPDFIVRFENFILDFNKARNAILSRSGIMLTELAHINKSERLDYRNYYTKDLVDLVGAYYSDDLENFNYNFIWD